METERNIGEIFEENGKWYQCIKGDGYVNCSFDNYEKCRRYCSSNERNDDTPVIFKELRKIGEPFIYNYKNERLVRMQEYGLFDLNFCKETDTLMIINDYNLKRISIEIKQTKEDMEDNKLNLKPFDIQKAREGKPVCTRDGRKARIICFDFRDVEEICCLIAAIDYGEAEKIYYYDSCGKYRGGDSSKHDLMMLPEKKSGWINIYALNTFYSSKEEAEANIDRDYENEYIGTIEIEWEE